MKRVLAVLAGILLASAVSSQALAAVNTLDQVKKNGVLVVGVRDASPPFGFMDKEKGQIVGIEVDLVSEIARKLGVKVKLVPVKASERIEALMDGKVDLVAATFSKTFDREKIVDFSMSYFKSKQRVVGKKGTIASLKDLDGKKVAVVKGTTSEKTLRDKVPAATAVPVDGFRAAFDALKKGEADVVTGDGVPLFFITNKFFKDQYEVPVAVSLGDEVYAMAVQKGNAELLKAVNDSLAELGKNGEAKKIITKWFGSKDAPAIPAAATAAPAPPPPAPAAAPAPAPAPAPANKFGGVITKTTNAENRYVALSIRGTFKVGADVDIYNLRGEKICKGTVHAVYGDDVYVDATGDGAGAVGIGYPVGFGFTTAEAQQLIASKQDQIKEVKAEAVKEEKDRQAEIAADWKADQAERVKWQEDMTKTKMQYDYEYDDNYYGGGYGSGWGGGYYGW